MCLVLNSEGFQSLLSLSRDSFQLKSTARNLVVVGTRESVRMCNCSVLTATSIYIIMRNQSPWNDTMNNHVDVCLTNIKLPKRFINKENIDIVIS